MEVAAHPIPSGTQWSCAEHRQEALQELRFTEAKSGKILRQKNTPYTPLPKKQPLIASLEVSERDGGDWIFCCLDPLCCTSVVLSRPWC